MTSAPKQHLISITTPDMVIPAMTCGEQGPLVLCLHGFPDTYRTFRHLLPRLGAAGYRAIAPTMPGYHPRCMHHHGRYRLSDLVKSTLAIIDACDAERVFLLGHDWGAAVGYCLAAEAPERLNGLITAAVPSLGGIKKALLLHPRQLRLSWYMGLFQLGAYADARVEANNWALIDTLWRAWSPGLDLDPLEREHIKAALREPGVKQAALTYYRDGRGLLFGDRVSQRLIERKISVPTLMINGKQDGCMGPDFFAAATLPEQFTAGLDALTIPDAGHFLHLEAPERFGEEVLTWLNAQVISDRSRPEQHHAIPGGTDD